MPTPQSRRGWSAALAAIMLSLGVTGCSASGAAQLPHDMTRCPDQRPQICTREYNPVCATLADDSTATYATGCTACADAEVFGWLPGACPDGP